MEKRIGIIPIPFTSIAISRQAHTLFKAEKVAYQAKVGKEISDSDFMLVVIALYQANISVIKNIGGKYGRKRKE
jgi:hypothetical protein